LKREITRRTAGCIPILELSIRTGRGGKEAEKGENDKF